jgi:hypothetical protein
MIRSPNMIQENIFLVWDMFIAKRVLFGHILDFCGIQKKDQDQLEGSGVSFVTKNCS